MNSHPGLTDTWTGVFYFREFMFNAPDVSNRLPSIKLICHPIPITRQPLFLNLYIRLSKSYLITPRQLLRGPDVLGDLAGNPLQQGHG